MTTLTRPRLKFVSRPYKRRVGFILVSAAIALAWLLVGLVLSLVVPFVKYALFWGAFSLLIVLGLVIYLCFLTESWIRDSKLQFELDIDGDNVRLVSYNREQETRAEQQLSLTEVERAEYYEPRDVSSLALYGRSSKLEIPLWSFGPQAEAKIVDYVRSRGVIVVGIPVDLPSLSEDRNGLNLR